jgi:hypothetical protein
MSTLPKKLTVKQETISPAVWYVYEDDVKLCITNKANAEFFVALNDALSEAVEVIKAAEWGGSNQFGDFCPWCGTYKRVGSHDDGCQLGIFLAKYAQP